MTITYGACGHPLGPRGWCRVCPRNPTEDRDSNPCGEARLAHFDDGKDVAIATPGEWFDEREAWRGREDEANAWHLQLASETEERLAEMIGLVTSRRADAMFRVAYIVTPDDTMAANEIITRRRLRHLSGFNDRWLPQENYLWQEALSNIGWTAHEVEATITRICPPESRTSPMPTGRTFQGMPLYVDHAMMHGRPVRIVSGGTLRFRT